MEHLKGKMISVEGMDGVGKTTQVRMLKQRLEEAGLTVTLLREPGGTPVGEQIRNILLHSELEMGKECETLLFMAARAEIHARSVEPALSNGHVVVTDRWAWSTAAYQAENFEQVSPILDLIEFVTKGRWPDLTLVLDMDVPDILTRMGEGVAEKFDRIEKRGLDYFLGVRERYKFLTGQYDDRMLELPGNGTREEVSDLIWTTLQRELQDD